MHNRRVEQLIKVEPAVRGKQFRIKHYSTMGASYQRRWDLPSRKLEPLCLVGRNGHP